MRLKLCGEKRIISKTEIAENIYLEALNEGHKKYIVLMKARVKVKFGEYHKTLLHMHTPASDEYKLYN